MSDQARYRLLISGGGTGGHIFPALAIAHAFRARYPNADILFVGARGRMEMVRVPEAGYRIIGLWISGIQRRLTWRNLLVPVKLAASFLSALRIVRRFRPHVVVGTGGFASGPVMLAATRVGIPTLVQEQNSYAGITNKRVASRASVVCVAYEGMEKYFPKDKIVLTGNPVRQDITALSEKRVRALHEFGLDTGARTLLVLGGSLGARTINESILQGLDLLIEAQVQVIWQTGKAYYESVRAQVQGKDLRKVRMFDFYRHVDLAYAAADVVISRAGALSISELCLAGKPSILVPSPNVAEDHQSRNALALKDRGAALLIRDAEAGEKLVPTALSLLHDLARCKSLSQSIAKMARPQATEDIMREIEKLIPRTA